MHNVYTLKVILKKSKPLIWYRVDVPGGITFSVLSLFLDIVIGWSEPSGDEEIDEGHHSSEAEDVDSLFADFEFEFKEERIRLREGILEDGSSPDYYMGLREADTTFIDDYLKPGSWFSYRPAVNGSENYRVEVERKYQEKQRMVFLDRPNKGAYLAFGEDGEWAIDRSNRLTRYFIDYKDMPEEELTGSQDAITDTSGKSGSVPGFVFLKRKELPPDSRNIRDFVSVPGTEKPVSRQDNMLRCGSDYMREIADQFMQSFSLSSFRTRNSDSLRECLYFAYSEKELTELADDIGAEAYLPDTNLLEFMDVLKDSVREKVLKFSLAWGCANALLTPAIMEERMSGINDRQMETFRRALREKDERGYFRVDLFAESDDLASFAEIDYCFGGKDENTFFIPSDLAEAFAAIDTKEFHERRRQKVWLMDCLDIVDYYYGVIPVRKFYTLYKKYGTLSLEEMIQSIKSLDEMETDCVIKDDKIIYFSLLKDDDYKKLENIQAGKPYYFPTKAEVEEISWNGYPVSQKEIQELLAFFRENYFYLDEIDTEDMVEKIWYMINQGAGLSDVMDLIDEEMDAFPSQKAAETFIGIISRLNNKTHMLFNRGNTPQSLFPKEVDAIRKKGLTVVPGSSHAAQMLQQSEADLRRMGVTLDLNSNADEIPAAIISPDGKKMIPGTKKIYPNDPCPCGSGKKYKKCCGRK